MAVAVEGDCETAADGAFTRAPPLRATQMCISYTQCTVRLCQLHSQTLKPSFLRPPHTHAATLMLLRT
jgi:hypothetical protein